MKILVLAIAILTTLSIGEQVICPAGYYSTITHPSSEFEIPLCNNICPVGNYCPMGSIAPLPCPAGTYGSDTGLTTSQCNGPCKAGYYCLQGSISQHQHSCSNATYYCPSGSSYRTRVTIGYYTGPVDIDESIRYLEIPCEPGMYCDLGQRIPCPAGVYGNSSKRVNQSCTALCPEGYHCPVGASTPTPCPGGTYGNTTGLSTPLCSGLCSRGHFCPTASTSAFQNKCRPGIYGDSLGLKTSACSSDCEQVVSDADSAIFCQSKLCAPGYYCPEASESAQQQPCGSAERYCPSGAGLPIPVDTGYYSTGPYSPPLNPQSIIDEYTRTGEKECEPGYYCILGRRYSCLSGSYGGTFGLSNSSCSGPCTAGYYCLEASISATQFYCGDPSLYCPEGSSFPIAVPLGFYSYNVDGNPLTRFSIAVCPPGHYCIDGVKRPCPDGYYSLNGSTSLLCDGECAFDQDCPAGTISPT